MSIDQFFCLTVGIEFEKEDLFKEYQGIPESAKCGHNNMGTGEFCQVCGQEEPQPQTMYKPDEEVWPDKLLDHLEDAIDRAGFIGISEISDIQEPSTINKLDIYANGLNFYAQHDKDRPRIFLGKKIAHIQSGVSSDGNKWDKEGICTIISEVNDLLRELGIEDREAKFILHDDVKML